MDVRWARDVCVAHNDSASLHLQRRPLPFGDGEVLRIAHARHRHVAAIYVQRGWQDANHNDDVMFAQETPECGPALVLHACSLQSELHRRAHRAGRGRSSRQRLRAASAGSSSSQPRDCRGCRGAGRRSQRRARARRVHACRRRRRPRFVVVVGPGSASVLRRRRPRRGRSLRSARSQRFRGGRLNSSADAVAGRVVLARPLRRRDGRCAAHGRMRRDGAGQQRLEHSVLGVSKREILANRRRSSNIRHHHPPRAVGRVRRRANAKPYPRRNLRQGAVSALRRGARREDAVGIAQLAGTARGRSRTGRCWKR